LIQRKNGKPNDLYWTEEYYVLVQEEMYDSFKMETQKEGAASASKNPSDRMIFYRSTLSVNSKPLSACKIKQMPPSHD
jgi:hypothetical protein